MAQPSMWVVTLEIRNKVNKSFQARHFSRRPSANLTVAASLCRNLNSTFAASMWAVDLELLRGLGTFDSSCDSVMESLVTSTTFTALLVRPEEVPRGDVMETLLSTGAGDGE